MNYYLVKADPETDYSIESLKRDGKTVWTGVHNFQAINFIKSMKPGDRVFFYHSQKQKAIVGEAEVSGEPFENTNDSRPSWAMELKFVATFDRPLSLAELKGEASIKDFLLLRNPRLSVMPVPAHVLDFIKEKLKLNNS